MAKFEPVDEKIAADDYRAYFDSSCLRVWHLVGKARVFRIKSVTRLTSEMVSGNKREVKKQPKLELTTLKGEPVSLPLLLNKTNAHTIAQMYGNKPADWEGKLIELYPTTTQFGREERECIRVRNQIPKKTKAGAGAVATSSDSRPAPAADDGPLDHERDAREPGDDDEPPMGALETDVVQ